VRHRTDGEPAAMSTRVLRSSALGFFGTLGASLVCALCPTAALAVYAGDLDSSFSYDGRVTTDFIGGNERAQAVAIQSDGKIVAAGYYGTAEFALARYNENGTPDSTFTSDGRVVTDFGGYDRAEAVAIQSDGKIVVAGWSDDLDGVVDSDFAVARYNWNGTLDTTFSGDGKVITSFGRHELAFALTIQSDGKIVVAGSKYTNNGPFDRDTDFALARYNQNGSLDTYFDDDGRLTTGLGESDTAFGVAIQADGRIVAASESNDLDGDSDFALARYYQSGALDSSFDGDGKLMTGFGGDDSGYSLAIQDGYHPVVAGRSDLGGEYDFALARYTRSGLLDGDFSGDGKLTTGLGGSDAAQGVAIQSDGRIVAGGSSDDVDGDSDFGLARYNETGSLDSSFAGDGRLRTDFGSGQDDSAFGLALQSNRRIVLAGSSYVSGDRFALARYHGITDNTPPDTIIDSGPSGLTADPTPTFGFHSTESGSTFQCARDTSSFFSCSSPYTAPLLADGPHTFRVRAIDAVGNVDPTPATRDFTIQAAVYRPDALIRLNGDAAFIGNDIYNQTGDFQTRSVTAGRGATKTFYVRAQNDGNVADTITLRGCTADPGFAVRFFSGSTEITSQVTAGTYQLPSLAPQGTGTIRMEIRVQSSASIGAGESCRVTATSASDPARADQVRGRVEVVQ
jgi:uncharacterized delta-60 repeat protein